uniref:Uncharacterized protein n=1 Tax=Strongyloides papillosus TaxID=174720 RepID=A0A0N5BTC9_STREA
MFIFYNLENNLRDRYKQVLFIIKLPSEKGSIGNQSTVCSARIKKVDFVNIVFIFKYIIYPDFSLIFHSKEYDLWNFEQSLNPFAMRYLY